MNVVCLSASNNAPYRAASASTHACEIIAGMLHATGREYSVDIVRLLDYDLRPCVMCGDCYRTDRCSRDQAFNQLYERMKTTDGIFMVVPHYALLPSKISILFEKFQEISFLHGSHNPQYRFPLQDKPIALVVHGGQTNQALEYYRQTLLLPLAGLASSVGMRVVHVDEENPGAEFGIAAITYPSQELFCQIEHDWADVTAHLKPLVHAFDLTNPL